MTAGITSRGLCDMSEPPTFGTGTPLPTVTLINCGACYVLLVFFIDIK